MNKPVNKFIAKRKLYKVIKDLIPRLDSEAAAFALEQEIARASINGIFSDVQRKELLDGIAQVRRLWQEGSSVNG